jgi:hypothetical protein
MLCMGFLPPILIGVCAVPIALIWHGLGGVRVGDHPLCRACGFDLFGKPAGTAFCGECGADLSRQKAIVIGQKQRRKKSLGFGITLMILATAVFTIAGYGRAKHVNWWSHAPLWYVLRQAGSADSNWRSLAIIELRSRCVPATRSTQASDRILDAGLAYQADGKRPWDPEWGALIEDAQRAGILSDDRWKRYLSQSWKNSITVSVRPRVRIGDPIWYEVKISHLRLSSSFQNFYPFGGLEIQLIDAFLTWPGHPLNSEEHGWELISTAGGGHGGQLHPFDYPHDITPGEHQLIFGGEVDFGYRDHSRNNAFTLTASDSVEIPCKVQMLPADQPTVRLVKKPELAAAIRDCISVNGELNLLNQNQFDLRVKAPPVSLGFEVLIRVNGKEFSVSWLDCPAGRVTNTGFNLTEATIKPGTRYDVIFRSDPHDAASSLDVFEIWDGEIVFKDLVMK